MCHPGGRLRSLCTRFVLPRPAWGGTWAFLGQSPFSALSQADCLGPLGFPLAGLHTHHQNSLTPTLCCPSRWAQTDPLWWVHSSTVLRQKRATLGLGTLYNQSSTSGLGRWQCCCPQTPRLCPPQLTVSRMVLCSGQRGKAERRGRWLRSLRGRGWG